MTTPEPTAAALGRALAWRVFVDSDELSLGQFLERLTEYGEACVREAQAGKPMEALA